MKGNIGWVAAGKTPRRANYDGLLPVPGDGRYERQGFLGLDELPRAYRPEQGWFATANQMNLPDGFPIAERKVGFEWADAVRWQRIIEVLKANSRMTLADAMDLQNDDTSTLARRLVTLLRPLTSEDANVRRGLDLMKAWDMRDTVDSAAAAVFEVWIANHLGTHASAAMTLTRNLRPRGNAASDRTIFVTELWFKQRDQRARLCTSGIAYSVVEDPHGTRGRRS